MTGSETVAIHELTAELDLDPILERIVEKARTLTGADASYLSLNDCEREETYFRAYVGIRTEAFRRVRLKFGHGLGGLVASEAKSYISDNYLTDDRFIHVIDDEVRAEGTVSVIGVPMMSGAQVLGVLFVASRTPGAFTEEDMQVCEDLADHAAVAIANARLLGRLRREQELHNRLTGLALEAHDLASLTAGISEALGHEVTIEAAEPSGPAPADDVVEVPIVAGAERLGTLRSAGATLDAERVNGLEQAARVAALHLLRERAVTQASLRSRAELLAAISDRRLSERQLVESARHFGLHLDTSHRVLAVHGEVTARRWPSELFVAGRLGTTIVLVPEDAELPALEEVGGLSTPARGAREIAEAIDDAIRTLGVATSLGRTSVVTEADLGALSMLVDPRRTATLQRQARRTLAPLLEHDQAHDSGLVATLRAYLEAQGRPGEAAKRCFVHVNTLYYRLDRIRSLTDWDLNDPDLRLHLHLACRALDLTRPGLEDISKAGPRSS